MTGGPARRRLDPQAARIAAGAVAVIVIGWITIAAFVHLLATAVQ